MNYKIGFVLNYLKNIYRILSEVIKPNIWILDCKNNSEAKPIKVLYVGTHREQNYFIKTTFDNSYHKEHLGKKFFWNIYYILYKNKYRCSMAVIEGTFIEKHIYRLTEEFFVPFWTYTAFDLPLVATKKSAKDDIRRIKKNKLEYIVTKNPKMIDDFYFDMHKPMVQTRHDAGAYDFLYDEVKETMQKKGNELLLVRKEDVFISGGLMKGSEEIPELWKNGILDLKYWDEGAIAATYIYACEYFTKKGYKKISFGLVRGFLNDGLLKYKKKWNMTLSISSKRGFILKPLIISDEVEDFFMNNPFIYMKDNKLYGAVFINKCEECSQENYVKLKKQHHIKGLSELNIFSLQKEGFHQCLII